MVVHLRMPSCCVQLVMVLVLAAIPLHADPRNLVTGAVLGCLEVATLGMPLEVWKTRMGHVRNETALEALKAIHKSRGIGGFWYGMRPRLVESSLKGAILVYSRELILKSCRGVGVKGPIAAVLAGVGSGVSQTVVMGPATLLVVAANTGHAGDGRRGFFENIHSIHDHHGLAGFAAGSGAMACRQATNWGSRQGISEVLRSAMLQRVPAGMQLSILQEIVCGTAAGVLSTWNQPFEVLRIRQQAAVAQAVSGGRGSRGAKLPTMWDTAQDVYKQDGIAGFYRALPPRMLQGVWYTNFLLTSTHLLKRGR